MKYTHRTRSALAAATLVAAAARPAAAAVYTYGTVDGNGNGTNDNFSTAFGAPPSDFGTQLVFAPGTYTATDDLGGYPNNYNLNALTFNNSAGNTVTIAISASGPATPLLGGVNPNLTVNGGSVLFAPQLNTGTGTQVVNNGPGTLSLNAGVLFASNGVTSVVNAGPGTMVLADNGGYAGTNAVVNLVNSGGGTFTIGNMAAVSGQINVGGGAVSFAGNTAGDLFGNGVVLNVAAGASFDFAGNGEVMGGITGNGTVLLTGANVSFAEAGDRAFNGTFSGTGGVTQAVANALSLGGTNTYAGNTTASVAGATIRATAANALSPNSLVNLTAGSTLDPGGFSQTIAGLIGGGFADVLPVTANTLTVNPAAGATDTYQGSVAGAGNLAVAGAGTEVLNGAAGVTGTVTVTTGTLREGLALLSAASAITVGSAGTLDVVVVANASSALPLTGTGTLVKDGAGTLTLAASAPTLNLSTLTVNAGGLTLAASTSGASQVGTPALVGGSATLSTPASQTFNGLTLTGSLALNASAGTLALGGITRSAGSTGTVDFNPAAAAATITTSAANGATTGTIGGYATYAGSTWAVANGTVTGLPASAFTANAFAPANHTDVTAATPVAAGASTLDVRFNTPAATAVTLAGTATVNDGGILVTPAVGPNASTIAGGTLLAPANTDLVVHQFNTAAPLVIASALNNSGGTPTTVSGVATTTSTTITLPSTAGLFTGEAVAGSGIVSGARIVSVNSATSLTLTLAPTAGTGQTLTFTPPTELVKAGPGVLQLTASNAAANFNGSIGLNAGVLQVASLSSLGGYASNAASSVVIFNGGQLATTGTTTVTTLQTQPFIFAAGGGTLNVASGTTLTRNADSIYGSGPLTLVSPGTGILALGSNASPYNGPVTVAGGILRFTSSQFGSVNGLTVGSGGQYQINDNGIGTFAVAAGTPFTINGTGPAGYANPGAIAVTDQTTNATDNSTISNAVVVASNATVGVYSTNTSSAAPLGVPVFLNLTGTVSGPGTLTSAGIAATNGAGGVLTLTGSNTYAGGTVVASGGLRVNNTAGSGTGTGPVTVNAGATLGGTGTVAGTVAVSGIITAGANASTGIGTLSTGMQSWNAGGGLLAKVAATGNDRLILSGLSIPATPATPFTVAAQGTFTFTATGSQLLLATDTVTTGSNPFAAALTAQSLVLSTASTTVAPVSGDTLQLTTAQDAGGFELYLTDVAAPEPTSLLLAGAAAAPLALGRRRRRNGR